jgi:hypothetical protein
VIEMEKIAALELPLADARQEDEPMVAALGRADLSHAAPLIQDAKHRVQDWPHLSTAAIRLDHDGASKHHITGKQGKLRFEVDRERERELADRALDAFENGEMDQLVRLLAADVAFYGDGGGKGQGLPRPIYGAERVGRLLLSAHERYARAGASIHLTTINGAPGTLNLDAEGRLINVFIFEIADGQIQAIRSIINPDKLGHLGYPLSDLGRNAARD